MPTYQTAVVLFALTAMIAAAISTPNRPPPKRLPVVDTKVASEKSEPVSAYSADPTLTIEFRGATGSEQLVISATELERLSVVRLATSTPFTEGVLPLSGPSGAALAVFATRPFETVVATGLDGRIAEIEADVFIAEAVLATRLADRRLSVRENGPFWLLFDFDAADRAAGEFLRARSIAHVRKLAFR